MSARAASQSSATAPSSPITMRARPDAAARAKAAQPRPDGTTFAPTWQSAVSHPFVAERREPPEPAPGDVLEEDALDRILGAEGEDLTQRRLERAAHVSSAYTVRAG